MDSVKQKLEKPNKLPLKQFNRQLKATTSSLTSSFLLTKTKTTPPHFTPNVIYEISCNDCTATYNGQTNRSLIKRIKEHESRSRLHLHNPYDFSHNQSAPAHHSRTTGHKNQDSLGQNNNTHNYKIQDTTGPHRTHSH